MSAHALRPVETPAHGCPGLYFQVHEGEGPFVLLVHGMFSSRSHWLPNLPALKEYTRPVVAELYGHNLSPSPSDPACYAPAAYVREFERIREAVGAERWLVVGQSLGAALTLRYALEHPETLIAHAFTNSMTAFADEAWQRRVADAARERPPAAGVTDFREHPLNPGRNRRLTEEQRAAFDRDAERHSALGIAMSMAYTVPESSVRSRVHENRVPSLLVVGEREKRFLPQRDFAAATMPLLEVVALDAGHAVNIDAAAAFDAALRAFFGRHLR